jgi:hypothetical protein
MMVTTNDFGTEFRFGLIITRISVPLSGGEAISRSDIRHPTPNASDPSIYMQDDRARKAYAFLDSISINEYIKENLRHTGTIRGLCPNKETELKGIRKTCSSSLAPFQSCRFLVQQDYVLCTSM